MRNMNLIFKTTFLIIALLVTIDSEDTLDVKNYGKTWMYFPDGDGQLQVALLTKPPSIGSDQIGRSDQTRSDREMTMSVKNKIGFELYSRTYNNRKRRELDRQLPVNVLNEFDKHFRPNVDTKIIIHGWRSGPDKDFVQNVKDSYLAKGDYNIIAVNWADLASSFYYVAAVETRDVGRYTAEFIDYLITNRTANPKRFHIIGHSLGAHVAGFAASYTKNGPISRITGLDPAKPLFESYDDPDFHLDKSDADFVDIIHSCGNLFGYETPIGHADFYPNGGTSIQPGCIFEWTKLPSCSHGRSHEFYNESINSEVGFLAYPCSNWDTYKAGKCNETPVLMGDKTPTGTVGLYYLKTADSYPFAKGNKQDDPEIS